MRLAATAAERGHEVRLAEADPELGGHISLMARLPTRAGWLDAIENLARPVERSGVEVLSASASRKRPPRSWTRTWSFAQPGRSS